MCTMNLSLEIQSDDHVGSQDAGNNEDGKRARENKFFHRLAQRLPVSEVVEELLILGKITCPILMTTMLLHSKSIISMLFLGRMGKIELAGGSIAIAFANITGNSVMKGPLCGYGPNLLPSLWSQAMVRHHPDLPQNFPPPLNSIRPHISPVAKRGVCVPLVRPRPCHHQSRQGLPLVFDSRVASRSPPPPVTVILENPRPKLTGNNSRHLCYDIAPSHQLHFRQLLEIRGERHCVELCLFPLQYEHRLVNLHCPVENIPKTMGWGNTGLYDSRMVAIAEPSNTYVSISQRVGHELGAGEAARAQRAAIIGIMVALAYGLTALGALFPYWGSLRSGMLPKPPPVGSFMVRVLGLWWGLVAAQYSCVVMMLYSLYQTDWRHQAKRAEELTLAAGDEDVGTNLVP
ncbi:MATE efflux family protein [Actinidia rufa]|uniref:MATE efflux family protein n=1 Tax=Actinidia rufa TaxID=165716 RepID=A0A7J0E9W2_9ERIC|nr:MATE efflux family protein [Actinidia rufa]